ncbi:alpha/beta hydrolase [Dactylosporangium roseum]|uniref:Alpha/beta hydrolase n=1 Tax=Dactylosporangium roseum TaxID=47989 RepID=A0ABY5ZEU5_9ACTN|nr:alpha/beta hydrolase [Dactylosporangium roseum]UWZ39282.1 alpha/beta hydrolase [Dactylosporangium roseum]
MNEAGFAAPEFRALGVSTADGARLHVRHGPATGRPAFLLVHGVASNARVWDEIAGRLNAENHPTYAVDLRGHGESDGFDTYDTATAVRDVAAVAAAFGLTDAVVAGHSWGASISLRIAAEHPTVAAALALIDGGWADATQAAGWTGEEGRDERLRRWLDALALRFVKRESMAPAELRARLRGAHPKWSGYAIEAHLANLRVDADGALVPRLTGPQFASIVTSMWDEQPHRWFPAVTVPVMLLPVAHRYSPVGERRWRGWVDGAAAALSDATVRWYLDADHDVQHEQPERLARDLLDLARRAT